MAAITYDDSTLTVALTTPEKVAGLQGDVTVPLRAITDVALEPDAIAATRGFRAPGLSIPRRLHIGTWRRRGGKAFVVARRGVPAVRVRLDDASFTELLVSTPDAERVAADLRARAAA
jgi:hypothetical protein